MLRGLAVMYLSGFALLGGLLFQRLEALQALIDDAYKSTRARRAQDLATTLERWFAQTPPAQRSAEVTALLEAASH